MSDRDLTRAAGGIVVSLTKDDTVHVHHHDIEAHARHYNEGFADAVAQGLADDPSSAAEWLAQRERVAAEKALRDAAKAFWIGDAGTRRSASTWLVARADALGSDQS